MDNSNWFADFNVEPGCQPWWKLVAILGSAISLAAILPWWKAVPPGARFWAGFHPQDVLGSYVDANFLDYDVNKNYIICQHGDSLILAEIS